MSAIGNIETRQDGRDSLLLLAQVRVEGRGVAGRVKVRNLSAGGMMAEGEMEVARGESVEVELRNLGWVRGSVAWKQGDRFGIAFVDEIDPRDARAPVHGTTVQYDSEGRRIGGDEIERGLRKL